MKIICDWENYIETINLLKNCLENGKKVSYPFTICNSLQIFIKVFGNYIFTFNWWN